MVLPYFRRWRGDRRTRSELFTNRKITGENVLNWEAIRLQHKATRADHGLEFSTQLPLSLSQGDAARAPLLHVRWQVPTQWERLFLLLGSFPDRGVCSQSPDKKTALLIDSCGRQSSSWVTDGIPTQELAEALLQGCLLTGRLALAFQAGSLRWNTCSSLTPAQSWRQAVCRSSLGVQDRGRLQGSSTCRDIVRASWLEATLYWLIYIYFCKKFQILLKIPPILKKKKNFYWVCSLKFSSMSNVHSGYYNPHQYS